MSDLCWIWPISRIKSSRPRCGCQNLDPSNGHSHAFDICYCLEMLWIFLMNLPTVTVQLTKIDGLSVMSSFWQNWDMIPGDSPSIFPYLGKIWNFNLLEKQRKMTLISRSSDLSGCAKALHPSTKTLTWPIFTSLVTL